MLGKVYVAEAKYALARPLLTSALEIQRRMLGAQHPLTLDIMSNLARIYYLQGNVPEAEGLLKSVLEGRRLTAGPDHPFTLTTINNLAVLYAVLYQEQYQFAEAEPLLVQVLEASRRVRGAEHPDTLNATGNLAVLYSDSGKYSQAEPFVAESAGNQPPRSRSRTSENAGSDAQSGCALQQRKEVSGGQCAG